MGIAAIQTRDASLASEICEEVWVPENPHQRFGLQGIDIVSNGSASHHELRKLKNRLELTRKASQQLRGVYMYSNLKGGEGGRLYFDGASNITLNGSVMAQLPQFSID